MLSWDTGPCCKPFILMLLGSDEGHAIRAELIHFTSLRYRFHHCRDGSGEHGMQCTHKCQKNQCFAFWLLTLKFILLWLSVMAYRGAVWGELVHIKEYLVISRIEHSTNVKLFLLWASEIPAKYFSIFDYSRLSERELFFTWPQSVWLIARIIYTLNPDRPKGPWTGGFLFWHISKNQDEYLPSRHKPTLTGWLVGAE